MNLTSAHAAWTPCNHHNSLSYSARLKRPFFPLQPLISHRVLAACFGQRPHRQANGQRANTAVARLRDVAGIRDVHLHQEQVIFLNRVPEWFRDRSGVKVKPDILHGGILVR